MNPMRTEIRKQVKRGWLTRKVAALLLGFDLDFARLDNLIEHGVIDAKAVKGSERLINAHHVMSAAGEDLNAILDKRLPIARHPKNIPHRKFRVLTTATAKDCFRRQWDRLHRHIAKLIATPEEDVSHRELRLAHQLLETCRFFRRFDLVFTGAELQTATGLDDEYLPKTRRSLERRGLLSSERLSTAGWKLTLLDPTTGALFDDCTSDSKGGKVPDIAPAHDWNEWGQE
jgi:hypothetical protein